MVLFQNVRVEFLPVDPSTGNKCSVWRVMNLPEWKGGDCLFGLYN